jgi:hypothetical protein
LPGSAAAVFSALRRRGTARGLPGFAAAFTALRRRGTARDGAEKGGNGKTISHCERPSARAEYIAELGGNG